VRGTLKRLLLALLVLQGLACGPREETAVARTAAGKVVVYAVSEPLRSFAARIGGDHVEVQLPLPPEVVDPASWNPSPEIVAAYQAADLVLLNGGGYARWVAYASLRRARLVDTSTAFVERMIPLEGEVTHAHGPEGGHSDEGVATTFWLDLELARAQARAVLDALVGARPELAAAFGDGHAALDAELAAIDASFAAAGARLSATPIVFSHPVYAYLARRYGLEGRSLHWEPDQQPNEREWEVLEGLLRDLPAPLMIWEDEPLPETASRLAGLGLRVVVIRPSGSRPPGGDFVEEMRANVERLQASIPLPRGKLSP